ncbi:MAG: hypothetical protein UW89_C0008G0023 [Parcubacteria group bacterium GW2011_GWB1_45_10]|nr:MAG: hypothetical protein UW89_C0008G0023 [Parcubacteria group bacterium GW2011_GWB1_45_10]
MAKHSLFIIHNSGLEDSPRRSPAKAGRRLGQTVIEMLVIFSVTTLFLGIVLTFNRTAKNQNDLFQFTDKFVLDIRKVQDLAYLSQQYNGSDATYAGVVPCGYGILFDEVKKDRYTVFAAFNPDCSKIQQGSYTSVPIETSTLPSLVRFIQFSSNPVIFVPPYPRSLFFPSSESMTIRLSLSGPQTVFRDILINKAGQISRVITEQ